jgi:hypothetical protein
MDIFWGLPILLSFNKAKDNIVWDMQLSKAARALIYSHTFTVLRIGVMVHALAATSQQQLCPHFGFSLE